MDLQQRTRRFCAYVMLCACLLRFFTGGLWKNIVSETGRSVRFLSSSGKNLSHFRESPAPWLPEPDRPAFSGEDASHVEMDYDCALRPDLEALLETSLHWDLTGEKPTVLILHTHTTESYTKTGENYDETSRYRTLDERYNMLSIGDRVAEILTEAGITVLHDRQIHDYPSYNGSYVHARAAMETVLEEYPSVRLVLDLHRDAVEVGGKQLRPLTAEGDTAQLMLVVGTNISRQSHENWEDNLALALKLQVQLERQKSGIMRPLNLRSQRFNQDLSSGALLVEVGAAGNTHSEALAAAEVLAEGIISLARGTATEPEV